jgi:hypothetical protein
VPLLAKPPSAATLIGPVNVSTSQVSVTTSRFDVATAEMLVPPHEPDRVRLFDGRIAEQPRAAAPKLMETSVSCTRRIAFLLLVGSDV